MKKASATMNPTQTVPIKLRLRELPQLFNSMDPSPFHDRDLDKDAEEFILSWARELPPAQEIELVLHLTTPPPPERAKAVEAAVQRYFAQRVELKDREYRLRWRRGRISLFVGLLFLAGCLLISELLAGLGESALSTVVKESLTIGGWVALWRPLDFFLYEWWPVRGELRLVQRLARMRVRLDLPAG
jgi:hypothetical protein